MRVEQRRGRLKIVCINESRTKEREIKDSNDNRTKEREIKDSLYQ